MIEKDHQHGTKQFWKWFETIEQKLFVRSISLRKTLEYLDTIPGPVTIVETGCARNGGDWSGNGGSTLIWDRYVQSREIGSHVYSVDNNENSISGCQSYLSNNVTLTQADSVQYLYNLKLPRVDLIYLDSYDLNWEYWQESAAHHLKELVAARHLFNLKTLLLIDDSPEMAILADYPDGNQKPFVNFGVSGKGHWISKFAIDIGAKMLFHHYQVGYIGFAPN